MVGAGDLGDLRRHGGRGHDRQAAPLAREARHRRSRRARCRALHPRRRRRRAVLREPSVTSTSTTASASRTTTIPIRPARRHRGRRFTLGDMGYVDDDGYLFISDRAKDMIITGGTNVYPAEIEGQLLGHPTVADVAVIGVPDAEWGETVVAIVQPAARRGSGRRAGRGAEPRTPKSASPATRSRAGGSSATTCRARRLESCTSARSATSTSTGSTDAGRRPAPSTRRAASGCECESVSVQPCSACAAHP